MEECEWCGGSPPLCFACKKCSFCCECELDDDSLFDADELGLDPEQDDERRYR